MKAKHPGFLTWGYPNGSHATRAGRVRLIAMMLAKQHVRRAWDRMHRRQLRREEIQLGWIDLGGEA